MSMKRERLSVDVVAGLIREKRGNVSSVAKAVGWSRSQVDRFIHRHPTLMVEMDDARNEMTDSVISEFYRACLDPTINQHVTAMIFYLKTRAGWIERQEIGMEVENAKVNVYLPDNNRGDNG